MTSYNLGNKVSYVLTDNAANMKAAFAVRFPDSEFAGEGLGEMDESDEDEFLAENQDLSVDLIEAERLSCFAHSLQLAVGDGLKETKAVSAALSKAVSVSSLLHRSTSYKV